MPAVKNPKFGSRGYWKATTRTDDLVIVGRDQPVQAHGRTVLFLVWTPR